MSDGAGGVPTDLDRHPYCYLTTVGRITGRPHRIEIWFAQDAARATVHLLSGGGDRADWVRNLVAEPRVEVEVGAQRYRGVARMVDDPDEQARARAALYAKYAPEYAGDLRRWRDGATPVAVDLTVPGAPPAPVDDASSSAPREPTEG